MATCSSFSASGASARGGSGGCGGGDDGAGCSLAGAARRFLRGGIASAPGQADLAKGSGRGFGGGVPHGGGRRGRRGASGLGVRAAGRRRGALGCGVGGSRGQVGLWETGGRPVGGGARRGALAVGS